MAFFKAVQLNTPKKRHYTNECCTL